MPSGYTNRFKRFLCKIGIYRKRACGNFHPFWDRFCFCKMGEYSNGWGNGILDIKTNICYEVSKTYSIDKKGDE